MKINLKRNFLLYSFGLIIIVLIIIGNRPVIVDERPPTTICHKRDCYQLIIVEEPQDRERGLAGLQGLEPHKAMLFVFELSGQYAFWMKGMLFDLDIIWLDKELNIVALERGAKACTEMNCPLYEPHADALYVLEVASGKAQSWQIGDRLRFKK